MALPEVRSATDMRNNNTSIMDPHREYCFKKPSFDDDDHPTETSYDQLETENHVLTCYRNWQTQSYGTDSISLWRQQTIQWIYKNIISLPKGYTVYRGMQPWVVYWLMHSLDLLSIGNDQFLPQDIGLAVIKHLHLLQTPQGGFSGDFGCEPHALTTYAAIMALVTVGVRCNLLQEAISGIDLQLLRQFYRDMKLPKGHPNYGAFTVSYDAELDTRSVYSVISVAYMLNIVDDELIDGTPEWLARCQTYEGGLAAEPYTEAHGGYTFCGVAALHLMQKMHLLDLDLLERWVAHRQMEREGGFCGRTNKLVDSCYSYWVGGVIPLIYATRLDLLKRSQAAAAATTTTTTSPTGTTTRGDGCGVQDNTTTATTTPPPPSQAIASSETTIDTMTSELHLHQLLPFNILPPQRLGWILNQRALQLYLLCCCQSLTPAPGFRDKPFKHMDFYHTCYSLSGLSMAQYSFAHLAITRGDRSHYGYGEDDREISIVKDAISDPSSQSDLQLGVSITRSSIPSTSTETSTLSTSAAAARRGGRTTMHDKNTDSEEYGSNGDDVTHENGNGEDQLPREDSFDSSVEVIPEHHRHGPPLPFSLPRDDHEEILQVVNGFHEHSPLIFGDPKNLVHVNSAIFNVSLKVITAVRKHLGTKS